MKNLLRQFLMIILLLMVTIVHAQEFHPIWNEIMPNSKGLALKDSIDNERLVQVATPGITVFAPAKAVNKKVAVLIIPSGGYKILTYQTGGVQLAKWFNTLGITAVVLSHRLPHSSDLVEAHKAPLQDAQRAMKYIRDHADLWNIDMNKVGAMGCSAGGHLTACLATINEDWSKVGDDKDSISFRPNFTILVSPVITMGEYTHGGSRNNLLGKEASQTLIDTFSCEKNVSKNTPPAFIVHATDDKTVPSMNSVLFYSALKQNNIKGASLHIYPSGDHSISLRNNPEMTNTWSVLAELWMKEMKIIN